MVRKYLLLTLLLTTALYADTGFKDSIQITETDNAPKCMAGQVKFTPGTVTCNGNVATVATGGTAASLQPGSTNYIQNRTSPQSDPSSANISSATIRDELTTSSIVFRNKNGMLKYTDKVTFLSMPDAFSTFFGYNTAAILPTDSFNNSFGSNAMPYPGGGAFNNAFGPFTMSGNVITGAQNNNAMGYAACGNLRNGFYNNCMGGSAGNVLRDGNYNTFDGAYAGSLLADMSGNTDVGFAAGRYQTLGNFTTGIGYQAGTGTDTVNANTSGTGDTYIGANTGQDITSSHVIDNSIAIGNGALVHASLKAQIGGQPGTGLEVETLVSSITANNGWMQLAPRTAAILRSITPTVVGQQYYCSDCTALAVCISTGTGVGAYASLNNKTTACN